MENNFEQQMNDVKSIEGVVGCLLTDQSGLCLGVKGDACGNSAWAIAAVNNLASKLELSSKPPIVTLQNESRQCIIQQKGSVIGAVYKNLPS